MPESKEPDPNSPAAATLRSLKEALRLSPQNIPLRLLYAQTLAGHGFLKEAEREYRHLLNLDADNEELKFGLAETFFQQGKNSHALVIVEELARSSKKPARALMLQARLHYRAGDIQEAVQSYHHAVDADPSVADEELRIRLGISAEPDQSEVVEGKVPASWEDPPEAPPAEVERPKIDFNDVGGIYDDILKYMKLD